MEFLEDHSVRGRRSTPTLTRLLAPMFDASFDEYVHLDVYMYVYQ
jgi:hypothetical protein